MSCFINGLVTVNLCHYLIRQSPNKLIMPGLVCFCVNGQPCLKLFLLWRYSTILIFGSGKPSQYPTVVSQLSKRRLESNSKCFELGIGSLRELGPFSRSIRQLSLSSLTGDWSITRNIYDWVYKNHNKLGASSDDILSRHGVATPPMHGAMKSVVLFSKFCFLLVFYHLPVFLGLYALNIFGCSFALLLSFSSTRRSASKEVTWVCTCLWKVCSNATSQGSVFRFLS